MKKINSDSKVLAGHFFRHSYSKIVAVLIRYFGLKQVEIAEDIVQDVLVQAMEQWSIKGIPDNPEGWLMDVAKKKTINLLKRNQLLQNKILPQLKHSDALQTEIVLSEEVISNSTLKMIFTCCHPDIAVESQIALALKTLCGFSIPEIAHALLSTEANINKRLYRAKVKFRNGTIDYAIPQNDELPRRITVVCKTLYLLFNEGYYSVYGKSIVQKELCFEAIRLQEILKDSFPDSTEIKALLALMYLHFARMEGRIDKNGILITLEAQDRNLWDQQLIGMGLDLLTQSISSTDVNTYQLQAGIAAEHAMAKNFSSTNWKYIYKQYGILSAIDPNPIVLLNEQIARFYFGEQEEALLALEELTNIRELKANPLLYCTLYVLCKKLKKVKEAALYHDRALEFSSAVERLHIKSILTKL